MATVDQLTIELRADTGQYERGMSRAGKTTQDFSAIVSRARLAGAAIGAALVTMAKNALDAAGKMKDLSMESGIAASTLSALNSPLQQSGSSVDEFAASVVKMNRALSDAASGDNKQLSETFNQLGLSITELRGMSPEKQLDAITAALAKIEDQGDLTRLGVSIFGRSFSALIPIIRDTNGNLSEYSRRAQEAGDALTDEQIDRLDAFGDSLTALAITAQNFSAVTLINSLDFIDRALIGIAQNGILALRTLGLLDKEIANSALTIGDERADLIGKPVQGAPAPPEEKKANNLYRNINKVSGGLSKGAKDAEKLRDELEEISRTLSLDLSTVGLSDVDRKTAELDNRVAELTKRYGKLTAAQREQIDLDKEKIRRLDEVNAKQEDARAFTESMGNAFSDAFEKAALGADGFGDVLDGLLKQIQSILFRQVVGNPLSELLQGKGGNGGLLGELFSSSGGGSSIFSGLSDFLPSFAVGTNNVPDDMIAQIHKGEMIVPAYDAARMRNGGMGGGVQINVINNSSAKVSTQSSQNSSGGTDIQMLIDDAVANNIGSRGSKTSQALSAYNSQSLVRR